jgi:UDP-N-acetylmuramoyl-L-alanyl-D-glutamate--2,6-diaminopimelate ligase
MKMKQKLVATARKVLPPNMVRRLEEGYRRGRTKLVSIGYGQPVRNLKVIAVTGTNGKTTTLSYINEILKEANLKTAMFSTAVIEIAGRRSLNDLNVTIASTVRMQKFFKQAKQAKVDYVLLEVTSHALHQHKLGNLPIEAVVMTNLTQDHLDYHKTMEQYAAVKGMLFANKPRFIVLNRDDDWFDFFDKYQAGEQKINYGTHAESEVKIKYVKLYRKGSEVRLLFDSHLEIELATVLPGKYNVYNMTAAVTLAYLLGINLSVIKEGAANLEAVPGRFERAVEGLGYDVIVDYAHTPDALEKLLETAKTITKNRVILTFGATGDRDKTKRPIMGQIAAKLADRIILTDEESYNEDPKKIRDMIRQGIIKGGGDGKTTEVADRREAIMKALSIAKKGDMILITGMGHEQYRIINGERLPWNDTAVVREILQDKEQERR